jgi:hypothetical protein
MGWGRCSCVGWEFGEYSVEVDFLILSSRGRGCMCKFT